MSSKIPKQTAGFRVLHHRQDYVIDRLKQGEIDRVRWEQPWPSDEIVRFGLDEGLLKPALQSFPDPRKDWDVPIEVMLLAHVMQRLNNEHSLLLAPYMLNSAELITRLGYNVSILEEGFNDRAVYPREASFHGETMKHLLMNLKGDRILGWFNDRLRPFWEKHSPGRTRQYIVDGCDIPVPEKHVRFYKNAGTRRNDDETYTHGYKAVWLYEIIDHKGVIVAMTIAPINRHDIEVARPLIDQIGLEKGSMLIMDRGFIDSAWITHLKRDRGIDVCLPLRRNMECVEAAVTWADRHDKWVEHPNPKRSEQGQKMAAIHPPHLFWNECPELQSGALVRWKNGRTGQDDQVLFVTTKLGASAKQILAIYDQRPEIEEMHRQVKLFQGIEKLPSKKYSQVVFRIVMGVIGYNVMNLFLNSKHCATYDEFSLKTLRQKRKVDRDPNVMIYAEDSYAILRNSVFMPLCLRLADQPREKLATRLEQDQSAA